MGKRTPEEFVASFAGHVVDDDSEAIIDSMEPIVVPQPVQNQRPMTLSPQITEQMKLKVAAGNTIPVAAAALGIPHAIWSHWGPYAKRDQQAGKVPGWNKGESPYLMWAAAMQQAKAACEESLLLEIRQHAEKDWKAPAWILSRRFPDRWGDKKAVAVTVRPEQAAQQRAMAMSSEELAKELAADPELRKLLTEGE